MNTISIRLPSLVINSIDQNANQFKISRTEYIRKAIDLMNKKIIKLNQRKRMQKASLKTREDSLRINKEFEAIEYG